MRKLDYSSFNSLTYFSSPPFPSFEYTQLFKYRIKANLGLAQRDELSWELKSRRWGITSLKGESERETDRQTGRNLKD